MYKKSVILRGRKPENKLEKQNGEMDLGKTERNQAKKKTDFIGP